MEQIQGFDKSDNRKKIEKIIEKAKRYLKIGSVASIGLFLQGCTEQEKDALVDSIKNTISLEDKKNLHNNTLSENESAQTSFPEDSKYRNISYEEFLKSGLYSDFDNSEHAEMILAGVEIEKEIKEIQSKTGNYEKLSDKERERILSHKIENLEYLRDLQEKYSPESKYKELKSDIEHSYAIGDEQRAWLFDKVNSNEYKERLSGEFDDPKISEKNYKIRKMKLSDKDYNVHPQDTLEGDDKGTALAWYTPKNDNVEITRSATSIDRTTPVHEFTHDMTIGNFLLSKKAVEMYSESFDKSRMIPGELERIEYLKDPTERDARKKQLEFELEELGVKKYGEEFTDAHYNKIIELQNLGKFSEGADQFIRMTKPSYFKKIMNEIAERKMVNTDQQDNNA